MGINASKVRFPIDAENLIRAESAAAITASAASSAKPLGALSAYWNAGELAMPLQLAAVLFITSIDRTTGDESYTFTVQVSADEAFTSPVDVVSASYTTIGEKVIAFTREQVLAALPAAAFVRVNVTLAGTTPSVDYWGEISPLVGR